MYYYMNPRSQIMVMQVLLVMLVFIIMGMMYSQYSLSSDMKNDINNIDFSCPDVTCPTNNKCPDCVCPEGENKSHDCPSCPKCPDNNTNCPSVDDIVSGLFPGRSTGLTTAGKYFEINTDETYELLPDYSYFDAGVQFPDNPVLDQPLITGNPDITSNQISNSIENLNIDTNTQESLSGMNMGLGSETRTDLNSATESIAPPTSGSNPRSDNMDDDGS